MIVQRTKGQKGGGEKIYEKVEGRGRFRILAKQMKKLLPAIL